MLQVLVLESNEIEKLSVQHVCERLGALGVQVTVSFTHLNNPDLQEHNPILILLDFEDQSAAPALKERFPNACLVGILYQRLHKGAISVPPGFDGLLMRENVSPLSLLPWVKLGAERASFSMVNASLSTLSRTNEALRQASLDFAEMAEKSDDEKKESLEIL